MHEELGFTYDRYYRNATMVDFDQDGDLDLYFGNLEGPNSLFENRLASGPINWLQVKARGAIGTRDALGALVEAVHGDKVQMREVDGGSTFASLSMRTVHFGLGGVEELDELRVRFQSGLEWRDRHVGVNRILEVVEPVYTVETAVDEVEAAPGETLTIDYRIKNWSAAVVAANAWVDARDPSGRRKRIDGPIPVTLQGGESTVLTLTAEVPRSGQPGQTAELIFHAGDGPTEVIHKAFVDLTIR